MTLILISWILIEIIYVKVYDYILLKRWPGSRYTSFVVRLKHF